MRLKWPSPVMQNVVAQHARRTFQDRILAMKLILLFSLFPTELLATSRLDSAFCGFLPFVGCAGDSCFDRVLPLVCGCSGLEVLGGRMVAMCWHALGAAYGTLKIRVTTHVHIAECKNTKPSCMYVHVWGSFQEHLLNNACSTLEW